MFLLFDQQHNQKKRSKKEQKKPKNITQKNDF